MKVRPTSKPETLANAETLSGAGIVGNDQPAFWLVLTAATVTLATLGLISSHTGQPLLFTVLSLLAVCGLFFLLGAVSGRIDVVGSSSRAIRIGPQSIADCWPEASLITTRLGVTVYENEAFGRLVSRLGRSGLNSLEQACAGRQDAAEALFRLVRAGERGELWSENVTITGHNHPSNLTLRISVSPVEAGRLAVGPLVIWRLMDMTTETAALQRSGESVSLRSDLYNAAPIGLFTVSADETVSHMNAAMRDLLASPGHRGVARSSFASGSNQQHQLEALFSPAGAEVLRRQFSRNTTGVVQCTLDLLVPSDVPGQAARRLPVRLYATAPVQSAVGAGPQRTFAVFKSEWMEPSSGTLAHGEQPLDSSFARHFEAAPFGIATLTATGRLVRANPAFAHMVLDSTGGLDQPVLDVVCREATVEARLSVEQTLAEALAGQAGLAPVDFAAGPKGDFGRRIYVTPLIPSPGSREAAILYIVDTTEQKALEAKFAQSQKMEAVGKLAGGIAHDFNNVLTAIIGSADLMLQTHRASDAAHKDIQNIKQSANRAAGLVGKLMAFSRQQRLQLEVLALGDVVLDLRPMLKTLLGEKIDLQITPGRDVWYVKADRTQIDQILLNFAGNAHHAMPNGGSFAIRTRNVSEREVQKLPYAGIQVAEYVVMEVEDTGTGMPPDVLAKIFEPFFTTKEVGKGTGLGLATVYGIVKQSSGYIFTESVEGQGTVFRVYLPRAHVENEAEFSAQKAVKKELSTADLTGNATVLIVEDEDMVRSVAVRSLTRFGYTVLEAGNGYEALDVLAEHPGSIDIVVSDVVMPEMDGPAFLKEVRKTHPDLKIIFVSGHTNEAFKASVDENEVFAFLPKPFSLPQLVAKVKEELAR